MAEGTGCDADKMPFQYLALPVGEKMNKVVAWEGVLEKFRSSLSKWKMKMLSIGGRLSLTKSVLGSIAIYYMSLFPVPIAVLKKMETFRAKFFWGEEEAVRKTRWVSWDLALNSKEAGGLGIGSLRSFNQSLILKWKWRFLNNPDGLWVKVISSCYGVNGGFLLGDGRGQRGGVWVDVLKLIDKLYSRGLVFQSTITKRIGNGDTTRFWFDVWCGGQAFAVRFPRVFAVAANPHAWVSEYWCDNGWHCSWRREITGGRTGEQINSMMILLRDVRLGVNQDKWWWDADSSGVFTVASARRMLDELTLPALVIPTRWNQFVPIKVNVFIWRVRLNRLPVRVNLDSRGIDVDSVLCPCCGNSPETLEHVLVSCELATQLWNRVLVWLQLGSPAVDTISSIFHWVNSISILRDRRAMVDSIVCTLFWVIWNYRNAMLFAESRPKKDTLFESIVSSSFNWFSNRNRKCSKKWIEWMQNPLL